DLDESADSAWQNNTGTGQSTLHESFSSTMDVFGFTQVWESPKGFLDEAKGVLDAFVAGIQNNLPSPNTPLEGAPAGTLSGSATTSGSTVHARRLSAATDTEVFTIHQRFQAGVAAPLHVSLSPGGRAALEAGGPVQLTLTFTPASGSPLTIHATF